MAAIVEALALYGTPEGAGKLVLDPMAGTGRVHQLRDLGYITRGVELEPEWAAYHPETLVGDATNLDVCWREKFAAVVMSPPYGNRMADGYAGERCAEHGGHSQRKAWGGKRIACIECRPHDRLTYRIALGHELAEGSAAGMQWHSGPLGDAYRETMTKVLREVKRVLVPGGLFLLNIKDHARGGEPQYVPQWFEETCQRPALIGLDLVEWRDIGTHHMGFGQNGKARFPERLYVFRKP